MGRKYANKIKWKKAIDTEYNSIYYEDEIFNGYIAYIKFLEVEGPLVKTYFNRKMITADKDYIWLEIFPLDKKHCITAKYNDKREIIKWYIDIVSGVGIDNGVPYMEDMYLDLDLLPTGELKVLDRDELDEAFAKELISREDYENTIREMDDFLYNLDIDSLIDFCNECLDRLEV